MSSDLIFFFLSSYVQCSLNRGEVICQISCILLFQTWAWSGQRLSLTCCSPNLKLAPCEWLTSKYSLNEWGYEQVNVSMDTSMTHQGMDTEPLRASAALCSVLLWLLFIVRLHRHILWYSVYWLLWFIFFLVTLNLFYCPQSRNNHFTL